MIYYVRIQPWKNTIKEKKRGQLYELLDVAHIRIVYLMLIIGSVLVKLLVFGAYQMLFISTLGVNKT